MKCFAYLRAAWVCSLLIGVVTLPPGNAHAQTEPDKVTKLFVKDFVAFGGLVRQAGVYWDAVAAYIPADYRVRYRIPSPLGAWTPGADGSSAGIFDEEEGTSNCSLLGLQAECLGLFTADLPKATTFEAQVAIVVDGVAAWSDIAAGTFDGDTPATPGAPTALTVSAAADAQVTLTWAAPAGDSVTDYRIRWRVTDTGQDGAWQGWVEAADLNDSPIVGESEHGIGVTAAGASVTTTYTLANLSPGTSYEIAAAAVNAAKLSAWTTAIRVETTGASPDKTLRTLAVSAGTLAPEFDAEVLQYTLHTARIAAVTFTPVLNHGQASATVQLNSAPAKITASAQASAQTLQAGANTVRITVTAENGDAQTYAIEITRPPAAPQNVRALVGDAQLKFTWDAPADDGGGELRYRYRYSDDGDDTTFANAAGEDGDAVTGALLQYELQSATNGVTYAMQIAAANAAGDGAWTTFARAQPSDFTIDFGADESWKHGIIVARHLLGADSADLLTALAAQTLDAAEIATALDAEQEIRFDVDADGAVTARDAILIARYLLGVTSGAGLTGGQAADADAAAIAERIAALLPAAQ